MSVQPQRKAPARPGRAAPSRPGRSPPSRPRTLGRQQSFISSTVNATEEDGGTRAKQMSILRQRAAGLRASVNHRPVASSASVTSSNAPLTTSSSEGVLDVTQLQLQLEQKDSRLKQLSARNRLKQEMTSRSGSDVKVAIELRTVKSRLEAVEKERNALVRAAEDLEKVKGQLRLCELEKDALKRSAGAAGQANAQIDLLKDKVQLLQVERDGHRTAKEDALQINKAHSARVMELEAQLEVALEIGESLQARLTTAEGALDHQSQNAEQMDSKAQMKVAALEAELKTRSKRLDEEVRASKAREAITLGELAKLKESLQEHRVSSEQLRQAKESAEAQTAKVEEQLRGLAQEKEERIELLASEEQKCIELQNRFQQRTAQAQHLAGVVNSVKAENEILAQKVFDLEMGIGDDDGSARDRGWSLLNLDETAQVDDLQTQLGMAQKNLNKMHDKNKELKAQVQAERNKVSELERALQVMEEMAGSGGRSQQEKQEYSKAKTEAATLRGQLQELKASYAELVEQTDASTEELQETNRQLMTKVERVSNAHVLLEESAESIIAEITAEKEQLEAQLRGLDEQGGMELLLEDLDAANAKAAELEEDNALLESKLLKLLG